MPRKSLFSFRKSGADAPDRASKMGHIDKLFLGEDEDAEQEASLRSKFKEGSGVQRCPSAHWMPSAALTSDCAVSPATLLARITPRPPTSVPMEPPPTSPTGAAIHGPS